MKALYGRADLLTRASVTLERALGGHGQLLLFTGEPGIGKSSTMERLAQDAADRGAVVAWGRSWEAGGAPAYWPWMQVFRSLGADVDPFAGATDALALGKSEARFAVFDRAVRGLLARAREAPLAIVLDDLHAADAPSLLLLLLLSHELPRAPLLVMAAYRDAEVASSSELAPLLAKLSRAAEVMPLQRLRPEHIEAWLREVAPEASAERAAELYRVTEGQPLFVVEALRLGADSDARTSWVPGPRAVLDERLGQLSPDTRRVLEVASVLGREFEREAIAAVSEHSRDDVHQALNEALTSSITAPTGDAERFRFSHVLLRDRLYHELRPSRRAELHVRIGTRAAASGDAQAAAHHLFEAAGAAPFERIAEVALAAAEAALCRLAFEDAARIAERVLHAPEAKQLPAATLGALQLSAGEASIRLGANAAGQALCAAAADCAQRAGQPELFARAALAYATELATGILDPQMIGLLRRALEQLSQGDSALRCRVLARLCAALTPPEHGSEAPEILELMRGAIDMARRLGDRPALLYVLQFAGTVGLLVPERERFALLEESIALARSLQQPLVLLHVLPPYLTALIALGGLARAETLLPEYTALLGESHQAPHRVRYLAVCSLIATLRADQPAIERMQEQARALLQADASNASLFLWLTHVIAVAELRADPALLETWALPLAARSGSTPSTSQFYTWFLAGAGKHAEARARLHKTDLSERALSGPVLWDLHAAAQSCVLLADEAFAARLYPHAVRAADRAFWALGPGAIVGPSARALGDLARLLGRLEEARAHYARSVADSEQLGASWLVESCRQRLEHVSAPRAGATRPRMAAGALMLEREGDVWALRTPAGVTHRLKHGKGFQYLQRLIEHPGQPVHALELAGIEHWTGDAGPVLDPQAKATYGARLAELRDEIADAERSADTERASCAAREIEALAEQLAQAVGLGGRDRRAASDVERARINVQRRLKDAIDRIGAVDPALGKYLGAAVKTGAICVFQPF